MFKKTGKATDPSNECLQGCKPIIRTEQEYDGAIAKRVTDIEIKLKDGVVNTLNGLVGKVVLEGETPNVYITQEGNKIKIAVSGGGTGTYWGYIDGDIEDQEDLMALINSKADKADSIISVVDVEYNEEQGDFIITARDSDVLKWTVHLVEYEIPSPQEFPFTPATDGFYRKDIIVFGEGDIQYIQGVESENTPLEPLVPENTIFLTSIDIFGDNANPIEPTPDGYAKLNGDNNFTGENGFLIKPKINGLSFLAAFYSFTNDTFNI